MKLEKMFQFNSSIPFLCKYKSIFHHIYSAPTAAPATPEVKHEPNVSEDDIDDDVVDFDEEDDNADDQDYDDYDYNDIKDLVDVKIQEEKPEGFDEEFLQKSENYQLLVYEI